MHPTRRSLALGASIMLISGALAGPVAAAAPDNDDRADALTIDVLPFEWAGDLIDASTEAGEEFGCHNGGSADRSVWFAWAVPDGGTMRVTIGAGGLSEPASDTNAAISGPFLEPPQGLPGLDALRWCVNGVGDDHALVEAVEGGHVYLFQLSAVSTSETSASIRVEFEGSAHPEVAIAQTGGVSRIAGFARVSIGISCLHERSFWGVVGVNQRLTRTALARGSAEISGTCSAAMTWFDVFVGPSDSIPFGAGWAEVDAYIEVYGQQLQFDAAYHVTTVRLRNER